MEQEAKERVQQERLRIEEEASSSPTGTDLVFISANLQEAKSDDPDGVGAMDKLLESLRSGADFNTTRRYKGRLNDKKARASSIGIKAMEMLQEIKQN